MSTANFTFILYTMLCDDSDVSLVLDRILTLVFWSFEKTLGNKKLNWYYPIDYAVDMRRSLFLSFERGLVDIFICLHMKIL